jgi:5-methylcytosine-specific restriction endonuclease McrA
MTRRGWLPRPDSRCRFCGSDADLVLDHIVPPSRGGARTADNQQVLCRTCNASKGSRTNEEYLESLIRRDLRYWTIHVVAQEVRRRYEACAPDGNPLPEIQNRRKQP